MTQSKLLQNPTARLAGLLALAVVIVGLAVVSFGHHEPAAAQGGALRGAQDVKALLHGIPQRGASLGNPRAPVTMLEFADLQCPFCRQFDRDVLPSIVENYVRPGKVRLVFLPLHFLGGDSDRLARLAAGATARNRVWTIAALAYANQGPENSGWANEAMLAKIARAAGVDPKAGDSRGLLRASASLAGRYRVTSTPSFVIGRAGARLRNFEPGGLEYARFKPALDHFLSR